MNSSYKLDSIDEKICIFSKQIKSPNVISLQNKIQIKLKSTNNESEQNMNSDHDSNDVILTNFEHLGLHMSVS